MSETKQTSPAPPPDKWQKSERIRTLGCGIAVVLFVLFMLKCFHGDWSTGTVASLREAPTEVDLSDLESTGEVSYGLFESIHRRGERSLLAVGKVRAESVERFAGRYDLSWSPDPSRNWKEELERYSVPETISAQSKAEYWKGWHQSGTLNLRFESEIGKLFILIHEHGPGD